LAVLIGLLMQWIGAPVSDEEIGPVVEQILEVGGLLVSVAGAFVAWRERVQRGDVTTLGIRKARLLK
jgi:hypothetical protein